MMYLRNSLLSPATRCRPDSVVDGCRVARLLPARALVTLSAFVCFACAGGSGSGGFDISARAENESIDLALAAKQCQPGEGLTICPANETALDVPIPGVPNPAEGVDVSTAVDPADALLCAESDGPICPIRVLISVAGLTPGSAYQVAARGVDPLTPWFIESEATVIADDALTSFPAVVEVPSSSVSAQIAVLVFLDGIGTTTGELRTLAETGASFAFVTVAMPTTR